MRSFRPTWDDSLVIMPLDGADLRLPPVSSTLDEQPSTTTPTAKTTSPEMFQTTDLSTPTTEKYSSLSDQMEPSNSPGSAPVSKDTNNHDAQWRRKFSLIVYSSGTGGKASDGLELSALRVNWNVRHMVANSPGQLVAKIYNMAPETMAKVIQFTRVQVKAGYRFSSYGTIFDGTVVQYKKGKENPVDTFLELTAADGDDRYNKAVMTKQYAAGTEDKQKITEAAQAMGFPVAYISDKIGKTKSQRDETVAEPARSYLRRKTVENNASFYIKDGKLYILEDGKPLPGATVVLTPKTGLVNIPEVTPQGIVCQCLLNPQIQVGGTVKIQSNTLSGVPFTPGSAVKVGEDGNIVAGDSSTYSYQSAAGKHYPTAMNGGQLNSAYTSPTGSYKVITLEQVGDTRGDPWYSNMICLALDNKGDVMDNPGSVFTRLPPEAGPAKVATPSGTQDNPPPAIPKLAYRRIA